MNMTEFELAPMVQPFPNFPSPLKKKIRKDNVIAV